MDYAHRAQLRKVGQSLVWALWIATGASIVVFWAMGSGGGIVDDAEAGYIVYALGLLCGLLATFGALTQVTVMSRASWLEPLFGMDRLALFHRLNGFATIVFILLHPFLVAYGYALLANVNVVEQFIALLNLPFVSFAALAALLFITVVGTSIYIVRKRLRFEAWYAVHFMVYMAIALVPFHQLTVGTDLVSNEIFRYYWLALYILVFLNLIAWRFVRPLWRSWYFGFTVDSVVPETATATSVYITGRHLERFKAQGGQFVLVRFLAKGYWLQEHPFSLSMMPSEAHLRLTIRQLGDFTNKIPQLPPKTRVVISGPHGAFTHAAGQQQKVLYIAGGVGITPIRAMIQERRSWSSSGDAVLLYGNRTERDTIFLSELRELGEKLGMPIHNVLSDQQEYAGEKGFIDKEKLARLVPDIAERDIFLCGPPPMMKGVIMALQELQVPDTQIHYERFALHKKG